MKPSSHTANLSSLLMFGLFCLSAPLLPLGWEMYSILQTIMQSFMWLVSQQHCLQPISFSHYISSSELCVSVFP